MYTEKNLSDHILYKAYKSIHSQTSYFKELSILIIESLQTESKPDPWVNKVFSCEMIYSQSRG